MLHHLGDSEQPNADFEKAKQRSKNFPPARDENRSDRRQSDHDGLGQKYQGGQMEDCGNNGAVRQSHGAFAASRWFRNRSGEDGTYGDDEESPYNDKSFRVQDQGRGVRDQGSGIRNQGSGVRGQGSADRRLEMGA